MVWGRKPPTSLASLYSPRRRAEHPMFPLRSLISTALHFFSRTTKYRLRPFHSQIVYQSIAPCVHFCTWAFAHSARSHGQPQPPQSVLLQFASFRHTSHMLSIQLGPLHTLNRGCNIFSHSQFDKILPLILSLRTQRSLSLKLIGSAEMPSVARMKKLIASPSPANHAAIAPHIACPNRATTAARYSFNARCASRAMS